MSDTERSERHKERLRKNRLERQQEAIKAKQLTTGNENDPFKFKAPTRKKSISSNISSNNGNSSSSNLPPIISLEARFYILSDDTFILDKCTSKSSDINIMTHRINIVPVDSSCSGATLMIYDLYSNNILLNVPLDPFWGLTLLPPGINHTLPGVLGSFSIDEKVYGIISPQLDSLCRSLITIRHLLLIGEDPYTTSELTQDIVPPSLTSSLIQYGDTVKVSYTLYSTSKPGDYHDNSSYIIEKVSNERFIVGDYSFTLPGIEDNVIGLRKRSVRTIVVPSSAVGLDLSWPLALRNKNDFLIVELAIINHKSCDSSTSTNSLITSTSILSSNEALLVSEKNTDVKKSNKKKQDDDVEQEEKEEDEDDEEYSSEEEEEEEEPVKKSSKKHASSKQQKASSQKLEKKKTSSSSSTSTSSTTSKSSKKKRQPFPESESESEDDESVIYENDNHVDNNTTDNIDTNTTYSDTNKTTTTTTTPSLSLPAGVPSNAITLPTFAPVVLNSTSTSVSPPAPVAVSSSSQTQPQPVTVPATISSSSSSSDKNDLAERMRRLATVGSTAAIPVASVFASPIVQPIPTTSSHQQHQQQPMVTSQPQTERYLSEQGHMQQQQPQLQPYSPSPVHPSYYYNQQQQQHQHHQHQSLQSSLSTSGSGNNNNNPSGINGGINTSGTVNSGINSGTVNSGTVGSIAPFLSRLGLSNYISFFVNEGISDVNDLLLLEESDILSLPLQIGIKRKIISQVTELKKQRRTSSSLQPYVPEPIHPSVPASSSSSQTILSHSASHLSTISTSSSLSPHINNNNSDYQRGVNDTIEKYNIKIQQLKTTANTKFIELQNELDSKDNEISMLKLQLLQQQDIVNKHNDTVRTFVSNKRIEQQILDEEIVNLKHEIKQLKLENENSNNNKAISYTKDSLQLVYEKYINIINNNDVVDGYKAHQVLKDVLKDVLKQLQQQQPQ